MSFVASHFWSRTMRFAIIAVPSIFLAILASGCNYNPPRSVSTANGPTTVDPPVPRPTLDREPLKMLGETVPRKRAVQLPVYYATDRKFTGNKNAPKFYGAEPLESERVEYGVGTVYIPPNHVEGHVESRGFFERFFGVPENPDRVFLLNDVRRTADVDEFFSLARNRLRLSRRPPDEKQAFVFVHGYNVTFEEAGLRAAQLAFDLVFDGIPFLYSWPSHGTVEGYGRDAEVAEHTAGRLATFLRQVAEKSDARVIHIIAHSMGGRISANALRRLADTPGATPVRFHEVILAAADIDATIFRTQIAPQVANLANRFTVYSASNDRALEASQDVHVGYCRLGQSGECQVQFDIHNFESVDASACNTGVFGFGHSYYGDAPKLLADMRGVLGARPPTTRGLRSRGGFFAVP
jgi:esterase/lipase superfamily enzyme